MKVKMLKAIQGKVNGVPMGPYSAGVEYDLDDERAQLFIGSAIAELVVPPAPPVPEPQPEAAQEAAQAVTAEDSTDAKPSRRK